MVLMKYREQNKKQSLQSSSNVSIFLTVPDDDNATGRCFAFMGERKTAAADLGFNREEGTAQARWK